MSYTTYSNINSRVPQSQPLIGGTPQTKNAAGGFVYAISIWDQLVRFLILGSVGGSYYASEQKLTRENAENVLNCLKQDGLRTVREIVSVSDGGRAPKNDPAIFALAVAAADKDLAVRQAALAALPKVCRIQTHLFHFNTYVEQFRGRGKTLNRAVREWYQDQPVDRLAYGMVKYQQRDGWSNRDLLRLTKPVPRDASEKALFGWAVGKEYDKSTVPGIVNIVEELKGSKDKRAVAKAVREFGLTREMVPTEFLNDTYVQEALLEKMPPHALLRNLGNLAKSGLLSPLSNAEKVVLEKLSDHTSLMKKRVHPVDVLIALRVYAGGHSIKGDGNWKPTQPVLDATEAAFYGCFGSIEPSGKRMLFGVDVSGSMTSPIAGLPISSAEAAAVMAMVSARVEKQYFIHGFTNGNNRNGYGYARSQDYDGRMDGFIDLGITAKDSLRDACAKVQKSNFGGTDCALPMLYATKHKLNVDMFTVITDNETWAGSIHPSQALKTYREKSGNRAKLAVIATSPSKFSIADPADPLTIDFCGFDTAVPQCLTEFARM